MKVEIAKILLEAISEFGKDYPEESTLNEQEIESLIEIPPNSDLGDYAFPCFVLSKTFKMNPNDIAKSLVESLNESLDKFEIIQAQGPYVNFFVNRKELTKNLIIKINNEKDNFGKSPFGSGKILVEHTSINPNASPHVGRARNALIGDSIVKILNFKGFEVETHYLVNDISKQIAMLVFAEAEKLKFESMLKKYIQIAEKVKKSEKVEKQVLELLSKFENQEKDVVRKFKKVTKICVEGQEKILSDLGIKYDFFDYESSYILETEKILSDLEKTGKLFVDEDGRKVLDLKGTSIEGKMKSPVLVLTRSNGTGLYPLRDIAYTIDKIKKSKINIVVLGEDQKLYFEQIAEALKLLEFNPPQVVHYSFIVLSEKGKSKKMSTRKGDVVLLEDFLKDTIKKAEKKSKKKSFGKKIGIAAVKYSILKTSPSKMIKFNLDEALNFEGDTGPYLMYSYARAKSILKKSKSKNKTFVIDNLTEKEFELVNILSKFNETVQKAYQELNPSYIANYSYKLAKTFNDFYHSCQVIGSEENESFRISLVEAFSIVLKNSLNLIGIETLEEM